MTNKMTHEEWKNYLADIVQNFNPGIRPPPDAIDDIEHVYEQANIAVGHGFEYDKYLGPGAVAFSLLAWARRQYFLALHPQTVVRAREKSDE